jgi:hypothetical protein
VNHAFNPATRSLMSSFSFTPMLCEVGLAPGRRMGKLVAIQHELLLRHRFHMHVAASFVRARSRITPEMESRFKAWNVALARSLIGARQEYANGQQ